MNSLEKALKDIYKGFQKVSEMIERAVEINTENDRLRGREKEVEKENGRHLKEREQLEKERLILHFSLSIECDLYSEARWEFNES